MKSVCEGMVVFHKINETRAIIRIVENDNIVISLENKINEKNELKMKLNSFGEFLFFDINDINFDCKDLAYDERYYIYGTEKVRGCIQKEIYKNIKNKNILINYLKSNYDFEGFLHYTDYLNLSKIIKSAKLFSRNAIRTSFYDSANPDVIKRTEGYLKNFVRFFYSPNTPTNYSNIGIKNIESSYHMPIPVLLVFSEKIIYRDDIKLLDMGAYSPRKSETSCAEVAMNFDWGSIFSRGSYDTDEQRCLKSHRNAEFLVHESVDVSNIKHIIFRSQADIKIAKIELKEVLEYNLIVKPEWFNAPTRNINYLSDFSVKFVDGEIRIILFLHNDFKGYTHRITLFGHNKKILDIILNCDLVNNDEDYNLSYSHTERAIRFYYKPANNNINKIEYRMNDISYLIWKED